MAEELEYWQKAIPKTRDKAQSRLLLCVTAILLLMGALAPPAAVLRLGLPLWPLATPLLFSAGFAILVCALRAATPWAAAMGFLICFILAQSGEVWTRLSPYPASHPLGALVALFVLTYAATKFGRRSKEAHGLSEPRSGRKASQIVANLGAAGLFAAAGRYDGCIAALAEAAADTVSSEIGQAIGGPARLVTTWRSVPAGTDGGVTIIGTIAGLAAAAMVAAIGVPQHTPSGNSMSVWLGACAGLFFDSLLGATVERRGWIGNDLVNFASTVVAALVATALS